MIPDTIVERYAANRAETNLVGVLPKTKTLILNLNMDFRELDAPRGLAKDVTKVGHLGNGDVQVAFKNLDDLPYVVNLARQAFDKQMGAEAAS
jgi:predicted transport protein